jgi:drug/metabolite transporter (DMT)-like permease
MAFMKAFHALDENSQVGSCRGVLYSRPMTSISLPQRSAVVAAAPTLVIVLAAVGFGLVPLFAKHLQALGMSSPAIALYRFCFSALATLPFLPRAPGKRREALGVSAAGLVVGVGWIGYLEAVERTTVAAAGVVYMSYPIFALVFAWLFAGQRPGFRGVAAGLLVLSAAGILVNPDQLSASAARALVWSLPAPASFGLVVVVLACLAERLDGLERLACVMLGASLGLAPLAAVGAGAGAALPTNAAGWALVLGLAATTALLPQLLYVLACRHVGPARTSAAGAFELPTMFAVGWLAFGQPLTVPEFAAGVLILAATLVAPTVRSGAKRP